MLCYVQLTYSMLGFDRQCPRIITIVKPRLHKNTFTRHSLPNRLYPIMGLRSCHEFNREEGEESLIPQHIQMYAQFVCACWLYYWKSLDRINGCHYLLFLQNMKKEGTAPQKRSVLRSQQSPRHLLRLSRNDQNRLELKDIYTKTIYSKYNRLLGELSSKQKSRYTKEKHDQFSNQSPKDATKLGTDNQNELKPQIRVRKYGSKKQREKQHDVRKSEQNTGSIRLSQEGIMLANTVNALQSIYRTQNIPSKHRIEPQGLTTKSSYYGLQISQRSPGVLLENLKKRINVDTPLEVIELALKEFSLE